MKRITCCYGILLCAFCGCLLINIMFYKRRYKTESISITEGHSNVKTHSGECHNDIEGCAITNIKDPRTRSNFKVTNGQPYVASKRSTVDESPSIPHIIHQVWDTVYIPSLYHKWLESWMQHNPQWEYWLWARDGIKNFIAKRFPEYLRLHDVYTADIFRFDMIRYFVLYEFGGIYFDMDMECLKPLDNWTYGHQCLVSEETYAHPFVVREQDPPSTIVNGCMASRPHHPFFKLLMESLEEFAGNYLGDYLHATGPYFMNAVTERYLASDRPPSDDITILPPKFFFPTYDPNESDIISGRCQPGKREELAETGQKTCSELREVFLQRVPDVLSYTDHHWVHAYMMHSEWKQTNVKHIHEIIPSAKIMHT